jgi:DNA-directed RNA polymerase specialized sigma24 family protein
MTFKAQSWRKLTDRSYPRLYDFLDPDDRTAAKRQLETIHTQLVRMFQCYGSTDPETLAVDTIDRAAVRCEQISGPCVGPPFPFFRAFAKRVFHESVRGAARTRPLPPSLPAPAPDLDDEEGSGLMHDCLERCLKTLSEKNRELILSYYRGDKRAKIEHRKRLAERRDRSLNALRIQVCRVRAALRKCVLECVETKAPQ